MVFIGNFENYLILRCLTKFHLFKKRTHNRRYYLLLAQIKIDIVVIFLVTMLDTICLVRLYICVSIWYSHFRPDIADLMILGSAPLDIETGTLENESVRLPVIIIDCCDNIPNPYNESMEGVYALRINDTIFKTDDTPQESQIFFEELENQNCYKNALTWFYYFNVPVKKIGRGKLVLQNLGSVRIKYYFERSQNTDTCSVLPTFSHNRCEQKFFFKKNEDMVMPGQIKEINFTYFSNTPGIYEESWDFKILNVDFFKSSHEKVVVNLVGETVEDLERLNKNIQDLKEKINSNADYLMVFNLLQEAITKAIIIKPEMYPYKDYFLEADLFVTINPHHYYHQTKVQKLKEIFTEMTEDEWDLSVQSWRDAVVAKEFDERTFYYDVLKQANRDLLKPWSDNLDDLSKQKHRVVKFLLNNLIDKFYDEKIRITDAYEIEELIQESKENFLESSVAASPAEFINSSHSESSNFSNSSCVTTVFKDDVVLSVFYVHMYEHIAKAIETCAGVLSSLDLNRYVDYNTCPTVN